MVTSQKKKKAPYVQNQVAWHAGGSAELCYIDYTMAPKQRHILIKTLRVAKARKHRLGGLRGHTMWILDRKPSRRRGTGRPGHLLHENAP